MKKQLISVLLVILILLCLMVRCGADTASSSEPAADIPASGDAPAGNTVSAGSGGGQSGGYRVGGLLDGTINDMGWCSTAYEGLLKIEALGNEISYKESIPLSDMEESAMAYASDGYNVIFGHGNYFLDPIKTVSANYPDTQFFVFNGEESAGNYTSMQCSDDQQGYLMGYIAAKLTTSGKIAFVGGMEIGPIVRASQAFVVGAEHANPDVEAIVNIIGSFDDSAKAKETVIALADSGVDVVAGFADMATLGVAEGASEKGILCVANGAGYFDAAPDAVVTEVTKDTSKAYMAAWDHFINGTLEKDKVYYFGVAQEVIEVNEWSSTIEVDDAIKAEVVAVMEQIASGEIDVLSLIS